MAGSSGWQRKNKDISEGGGWVIKNEGGSGDPVNEFLVRQKMKV